METVLVGNGFVALKPLVVGVAPPIDEAPDACMEAGRVALDGRGATLAGALGMVGSAGLCSPLELAGACDIGAV